jgi:hypothetical protein
MKLTETEISFLLLLLEEADKPSLHILQAEDRIKIQGLIYSIREKLENWGEAKNNTLSDATEIKSYLSEIGKKGGGKMTEKKSASSRENGKQPCHPGKKRGRPSKYGGGPR